MSNRERQALRYLCKKLVDVGLPSYAALLAGCDLELVDDPSINVIWEPGSYEIVINEDLGTDEIIQCLVNNKYR